MNERKKKKGGGDKDHVLKKKFHWSFSFELKKITIIDI